MPSERTTDTPHLIRVTRGEAGPEEIAALTVALLLRARGAAAGAGPAAHRAHRPAGWRRLERALTHRGARSWRDETRRTRPRAGTGA
ncbi:acyl-CoA carboxylase epsilon subunit [Streptomyces echinoruber]|uniref:Acyl-CoA carboxylase subunit epsilon n=1 Tax=Streptomyces echinoruber TaxID=68898 RepID=A0A918RKH5_9ACTN|nr:acyl-CoA carboxylase epsilon subunit [Streptomyces echinoruber]GHA00525.1 hypothetical protein GCM10010389_44720 [Streptomyces echinoruber]